MFVTYADLPVTRFHVLWKHANRIIKEFPRKDYLLSTAHLSKAEKKGAKKNWKEKNWKKTATSSSKKLQECLTARQLMLLQCEQPKKWSKHMQKWNEIKHSSEIL